MINLKRLSYILLGYCAVISVTMAAAPFEDKFRQLDELLPTPNDYRTASGKPGHNYWQQRADYQIKAALDDDKQSIHAEEWINYTNNSPDQLDYLWIQLDQNRYQKSSDLLNAAPSPTENKLSFRALAATLKSQDFDGGYKILAVTDKNNQPIHYQIVKTMMRIDLKQPLATSKAFKFHIQWQYNVANQKVLGGRGGYEHFEKDGNNIYEISRWYPILAVYNDVMGWQNKQFLGNGEFTLDFGNFDVELTVPDDHIVAATGELTNASTVLDASQQERLKQAQSSDHPIEIVTEAEALAHQKNHTQGTKTWKFSAKNVRDFAWASSRKFIWDAQGIKSGKNNVMAMSYYPEEGNPLWGKYSTKAVIHTIENYNKYTLDYPYPVAISVNGSVGGMEYPMICFNGPRPEIDKKDPSQRTWSRRTKFGLISVIIHEVGHNYFPMIVNSDERQWTWMDEGLNTFVQFLAEQSWKEKYPSRRGEPRNIVAYMSSEKQVPIMTNSESLMQFGNNAYAKPATALNILRETIIGRDLFDFAFRQYAQRWKFKHPYPADFFRTMEDASGIDLDWFWRGWFYTTDHVDISLDKIDWLTIDTQDPEIESAYKRARKQEIPESQTELLNKSIDHRLINDPSISDLYDEQDEFTVTNKERNEYSKSLKNLEENEKQLLNTKENFYRLQLTNLGGLVMPLILDIELMDGSKIHRVIPAEIWRRDPKQVSIFQITQGEIKSVALDEKLETADTNIYNNYWPRRPIKSRLELFKEKKEKNLMKDSQEELSQEDETDLDTDANEKKSD